MAMNPTDTLKRGRIYVWNGWVVVLCIGAGAVLAPWCSCAAVEVAWMVRLCAVWMRAGEHGSGDGWR